MIIFETVDKDYNIVSLSQDTWDSHILPGHPEMVGAEGHVQKTVENADNITKDRANQTRYYYMEHGNDLISEYGSSMKVCVSIANGTTKSAYFVDEISQKEILVYGKNKSERP